MKYLESIKSLILLLLVLLSVLLSFSIWNFMPGYETIDKQPTVDITIGAQKRVEEVVKPYKLLFNFEDGKRGTENSLVIDRIFEKMKQLSIQELTLNQKISVEGINETLRKPNQFTFFYPAGVPFKVLDTILTIEDSNIPEESFTQMIVKWNGNDENRLQISFINNQENLEYIAYASGIDRSRLSDQILTDAANYNTYTEVQREGHLSLYLSSQAPDDMYEYTYLLTDTNLDQFKKALFPDPNVVRSNTVALSTQEFLDDSSKLTVDTTNKWINYVNPGEESKGIAIPSELIFNSIDFVNEHGGWTDDYRFFDIDPINKEISFGLHIAGFPAFSDTKMTTAIHETWGENDIFRYHRPFYDLGNPFPAENNNVPMISGKAAADVLASIREIDFNLIDEVKAGYNISTIQSQDQPLIVAEPSYFYSLNGNWLRLTQDMLGGGPLGLE
ncbi:YycH family regulatory protein [Chungangia koreensis]|uniref:YycH family regulatory protein n=1 Tax=Chungangia koreensis TaxID=752657 RepID=A0ABV8X8Z0_9LACT